MNTRMVTKLVAFGLALTMNFALLGSVAYLFDGAVRGATPSLAAADVVDVALQQVA